MKKGISENYYLRQATKTSNLGKHMQLVHLHKTGEQNAPNKQDLVSTTIINQ